MRIAQEVLNDVLKRYKDKQVLSTDEKVCIAMKIFAKEIIDDILTKDSLIHVDDGDAVYNYDAFEVYKDNL